MCTNFRKKFPTLETAEEAYHLTLSSCLEELTLRRPRSRAKDPETHRESQPETPRENQCGTSCQDNPTVHLPDIPSDLKKAVFTGLEGVSNLTQMVEKLIRLMDIESITGIANFCFMKLVKNHDIDSNPADFISRSLSAMRLLQVHGKANLLYMFAFCLSEKRPGSEMPIFQIGRMPFGMIEYQLDFFSCWTSFWSSLAEYQLDFFTNIMQVVHSFTYFCTFLCTSLYSLQSDHKNL